MKAKIIVALAALIGGALIALSGCKKAGGGSPGATSVQAAMYYCPMHPTQTSDKPGVCPICNMRLVPVESDITPQQMEDEHKGHQHSQAPSEKAPIAGRLVPGQADIRLSAEREQRIGVRTAAVEKKTLEAVVRASARVAHDPELFGALTEYAEALKANGEAKKSQWPDVRERARALVDSSLLRLKKLGVGAAEAR